MKRAARFKRLKGFFTLVGAVVSILLVLTVFLAIIAGDSGLALGDKVGIVKIEGVIIDSIDINRQIKEFADRDDIKAVIIRINSPGGSVAPSQEIYSEVKRLAKEKDVVASMSSVAASGGYYIALGADEIVANPGTITGSIGVIVQFMNFEGLLSKIGITGNVIKSGEFKDTGSPLREMNETERKVLQALVNDVQSQFVDAVVEGRNLKPEVVRKLADGRIFSGAQAHAYGLVDKVGGLHEAVELAAKLSGIEGEPAIVYSKKKVDGLLQYFTGEESGSLFGSLYSGLNILYLARPFK
jgi:protease-4